MTLKEMKEQVYRIIEELGSTPATHLTDDPDYENKINDCINVVQNELARIKPIHDKITYNTETSQTGNEFTFTDDMRQVYKVVGCNDYNIIGKKIIFDEDYKGDVDIYYYKYPELIAEDEDEDTYTFELDMDALEVMPFGVAGDMLKTDPSTNYGMYFSNRYNELKQMLDSRSTAGLITIEGGVDL